MGSFNLEAPALPLELPCFGGRANHCLCIIFLDEGEVPCPRSFHAITSIGTSIYIFGGCGPGFFHKKSSKQNLENYFKIKHIIIKLLAKPQQ